MNNLSSRIQECLNKLSKGEESVLHIKTATDNYVIEFKKVNIIDQNSGNLPDAKI